MKTIIAVWHSSNKGKTESLRELVRLIIDAYPNQSFKFLDPKPSITDKIPSTGDFRIIIELNNIKVGIDTQGDPITTVKQRLKDFINDNCYIIFCATRTRGKTVNAVDDIATKSDNYQVIWTSTYQIGNRHLHEQINRLKAIHLHDLMQNLILQK